MKRTPKNYDGIDSPVKQIQELLPLLLAAIKKRTTDPQKAVLAAWPELIGASFAHLTRAVSLTNGILLIKVRNSSLYSLLCQHERPHLLLRLQERFPEARVQDILFRIG